MHTFADLKRYLSTFTEQELDKPITVLLVDAGEFTQPLSDEPLIVWSDKYWLDLPEGTPYFMV